MSQRFEAACVLLCCVVLPRGGGVMVEGEGEHQARGGNGARIKWSEENERTNPD